MIESANVFEKIRRVVRRARQCSVAILLPELDFQVRESAGFDFRQLIDGLPSSSQSRASWRTSELFLQNVLQHDLIQRLVRDQLLEFGTLLSHLP
jgi:hypothetical protein